MKTSKYNYLDYIQTPEDAVAFLKEIVAGKDRQLFSKILKELAEHFSK